jgi:hypothetical protein
MKLELDEPSGEYQIKIDGATPLEVRLTCCSSCPVEFCSQMLDEGFARVATPPNGDGEAVAERIMSVSENARCLEG